MRSPCRAEEGLVAIGRPDFVTKLVVIGANYDTAGVVPEAEAMFAQMAPDSPEMATFRTLYEQHSPMTRNTGPSS